MFKIVGAAPSGRPSVRETACYLILAMLAMVATSLRAAKNTDDLNLVRWDQQAFSDLGSHIGLVHQGEKTGGWQWRSAWAFGSQADGDHAAKNLFASRVELRVVGKKEPLFSQTGGELESWPNWTFEKASQDNVSLDLATLYLSTDTVLMVATFRNKGKTTLRVRPSLVLKQITAGAIYTGEVIKGGSGEFTLAMDRSKLVQRKYVEHLAVMVGGGKTTVGFTGPGGDSKEMLEGMPHELEGAFELILKPEKIETFKPGEALRFPVLLSVGTDSKSVRKEVTGKWKRWALGRGEAYNKAKGRWNITRMRLPQAPGRQWQRLVHSAALSLKQSEYAPRAELNYPMFSGSKTWFDAFYSDRMPMICLGWAELDLGKAQQALVQLASFSAAKPGPVPPHTGEELLLWEAAGLPMHGFVGWELYHRDYDGGRGDQFIGGFGKRLLNESAWWIANRDGDGNGLFTFGSDEEKPRYMKQGWIDPAAEDDSHWDKPRLEMPSSAAREALGEASKFVKTVTEKKNLKLQNYSLALSSLVAWQLQASAAMAAQAGDSNRAADLLARARATTAAMIHSEWNPGEGSYGQGLDGFFPFLAGLDTQAQRLRPALDESLLKTWIPEDGGLPFVEDGVLVPWRAYLMLKTMSLHGYHREADEAAGRLLTFFAAQPVLHSAYNKEGKPLGVAGDAATAAVAIELAMERYQQESYLLPDTKAIFGRMLQVRSPEGRFFMKFRPPKEKEAYGLISLAAPEGGNILDEKAMIVTADEAVTVTFKTAWPTDVKEMQASGQWIFKDSRQGALILKPKKRYLFMFSSQDKQTP